MKKSTLLLCLTLLLFACEKEIEKIVHVPVPAVVPTTLEISEKLVIFSPQGPTFKKVVFFKNDSSDLNITITKMPAWINVNPLTGNIKQLYDLYISRSLFYNYPFGIITDSIEYVTILGKGYINVRYVNDNVSELIVMDTLYINAFNDTISFQVFNNLTDTIDLTLNADPLFTINSSQSRIAFGQGTTVNLLIDRNRLSDSTAFYDLNLGYDGKVKVVKVKIENFKEQKIKIYGDVIDSEFDKQNNKLIYVCQNPSKLVRFDPVSKTKDSILLNRTPNCISISKSGNYAVIGNDSYATLIELSNMSVINSFFTGAKAADIILKDSAFAYVMPKLGSHINFRCFDLQNNYLFTYQTGPTTSQNLRAKLHPNNNDIYTIDNDVNPEDIEKYNLSAGTAAYDYDSPYHGTYSFGGDIWISANGQKIVTKGKVLVTSSSDSTLDMVYNGTIGLQIPNEIRNGRSDNSFHIKHMDSRVSPNEFLLSIDSHFSGSYPEVNKLFIHNGDNLQFVKMLPIESFAKPNPLSGSFEFFPAISHFSYFTADPNIVTAIIKTEDSGFSNPWAIEVINL